MRWLPTVLIYFYTLKYYVQWHLSFIATAGTQQWGVIIRHVIPSHLASGHTDRVVTSTTSYKIRASQQLSPGIVSRATIHQSTSADWAVAGASEIHRSYSGGRNKGEERSHQMAFAKTLRSRHHSKHSARCCLFHKAFASLSSRDPLNLETLGAYFKPHLWPVHHIESVPSFEDRLSACTVFHSLRVILERKVQWTICWMNGPHHPHSSNRLTTLHRIS